MTNTYTDPDYLNNPADQPAADASAAEWLAFWQHEYNIAVTPTAKENALKRIVFWRTMIKAVPPAPLTNEQRRARGNARRKES